MADHTPIILRDPYRSNSSPRTQRWDSQRFALEQERERARQEAAERKSYAAHSPPSYAGYSPPRTHIRERSVGPKYAQRVHPPSFNDDEYFEPPHLFREQPQYERKYQRYRSPSIQEKRPSSRPAFLRRQSSLDTFDRKPLARYEEREIYSPPARYREPSLPPRVPIPLPNTRHVMAPRRHERDNYNDYEIPVPKLYDGDDSYREYPERNREREHTRRRGRRKSRVSRRSRSVRSMSSSSSSSSSSSVESSSSGLSERSARSARSKFPKAGRTKIPAKLVCRKAIIDLGYPFKEKGDFFIIKKALGREHIDELIKLAEEYKYNDRTKPEIIQERTELYTITTPPITSAPPIPPPASWPQPDPVANLPPPPAPIFVAAPVYSTSATHVPAVATSAPQQLAVATPAPQQPGVPVPVSQQPIVAAPAPAPAPAPEPVLLQTSKRATNESSGKSHENVPTTISSRAKDERAITAKIRALKAEEEVLRAQRRVEQLRLQGRGELIVSEQTNRDGQREEVTILRRGERSRSRPGGGIRIEKDHKGRMSFSIPKR